MSIYVAIYDIYPGDRKHLERLLERESDKRKADGNTIYAESFGSVESMLETPMKYTLFIVDAAETEADAANNINWEIAAKIREHGCTAPIILGYRPEFTLPEDKPEDNIYTYSKDITPQQISEYIDKVIATKNDAVKTYEIRDKNTTYYVEPSDIIYAKAEGTSIMVYLTGNRRAHVLSTLENFMEPFQKNKAFLASGKTEIFNMDHIIGITGQGMSDRGFRMSDGSIIPVSFVEFMRIWPLRNKYIASKS